MGQRTYSEIRGRQDRVLIVPTLGEIAKKVISLTKPHKGRRLAHGGVAARRRPSQSGNTEERPSRTSGRKVERYILSQNPSLLRSAVPKLYLDSKTVGGMNNAERDAELL